MPLTLAFLILIVGLLGLGYAVGPTAVQSVTQAQTNTNTTSNNTGHVSDGSLTGAPITNDQSTWPGSDNLWNVCTAIALAEGFNVDTAAPYLLNNPGDLSPGDEAGQATRGPAQFHGGSDVINFATCEGGFNALRYKFNEIIAGNSSVYAATDSWATVASKYAGNSSAWLNNITSYLGVDPSTTPADYVNGVNQS